MILASAGVALAILAAVYYFFDPSEAVWMPRCLWKSVTGTDCPGCGSQRMAHALLHGNLAGAWRANAFALCSLPVVAAMIWLEVRRTAHPRLYCMLHRPIFICLLLILILAWWLLRNIL